MRRDWTAAGAETVLRVDGGMTASDWTMQRLADILGAPVDRPKVLETTALGAAYLAGWQAGVYGPPDSFARKWRRQKRFVPVMAEEARDAAYGVWRDAVRRTLGKLGDG
jgi:glycerol kinase